MKINVGAWRVYRLRLWAGLLAGLVLASVEFGMAFRFTRDIGQGTVGPEYSSAAFGLGDCASFP